MLKALRRAYRRRPNEWTTSRESAAVFDKAISANKSSSPSNAESPESVLQEPDPAKKRRKRASPYEFGADTDEDDLPVAKTPLRRRRGTGNAVSSKPSPKTSPSSSSSSAKPPQRNRQAKKTPPRLNKSPSPSKNSQKSPRKRVDVEDDYTEDFEYWLYGMKQKFSLRMRCQSACSMMEECSRGLFRTHLRAANLADDIFTTLKDADSSSQLALVTAALFFALTRDRMGLDIMGESVGLLCRLLNPEISIAKEDGIRGISTDKLSTRVRDIIEKKSMSALNCLPQSSLSANDLAFEAILSLAEQSSGRKYLSQIQQLGGVLCVVERAKRFGKEIASMKLGSDYLPHSCVLYTRCLKCLSLFFHSQCPEAETVIKSNIGSVMIKQASKMMSLLEGIFKSEKNWQDVTYMTSLVNTLFFLINICCNNDVSADLVSKEKQLLAFTLSLLLDKPHRGFVDRFKYKIDLLCVGFLLNVAEISSVGRVNLVETVINSSEERPLEALVNFFEKQRQLVSGWLSHSHSSGKLNSSQSSEDGERLPMPSSFGLREVEVRMDRASEYGFLASHTALLLGCLIKDNATNRGELELLLVGDLPADLVTAANTLLKYQLSQTSKVPIQIEEIMKVIEILESLVHNEVSL